jgi:hypothetical protein
MSASMPAHLLAIPLELRQEIYDYLLHDDVGLEVVHHFRRGSASRGATAILASTNDAKVSIAWLGLSMTCKTLEAEIKAYRDAAPRRAEYRTYRLDINNIKHGITGPVTWRQIPCPPSQARRLNVNLDLSSREVHFWGDGGPMPIVRELYQTLNGILHYGPMSHRQRALAEPMSLDELNVYLITEPNSNMGRKYKYIVQFVRSLIAKGLLYSLVQRVNITSDRGDESSWGVTHKGNAVVPSQWIPYGFEWGVHANQEADSQQQEE